MKGVDMGVPGHDQQRADSQPPRVTLRQLQCFCAVVGAGFNLSRAALDLHVTHTVVGMQLRQLEEELGVALIVRERGRMVGLTERGERTIAWARRALQYAGNIRSVARDAQAAEGGSIALATSHTYANYVLLPAVLAFTRRYPRVSIHVLQGAPDQVMKLVREGKATIGVTQLPVEMPKDIMAVPFLRLQHILLTPPGHPLLEEQELTLKKIAAYPILVLSSSHSDAAVLRRFEATGVAVNVAMQALDTGVIKTYVSAGVGIAIVPAVCYSPSEDRDLRARKVDHLFEASASAVLLRRQSQLGRSAYAFLEMLDKELNRQRIEELAAASRK